MRGVMHHISVDRFLTPREMAERDEPYLRNWAHRLNDYKVRDQDDVDSVVNAAITFATTQYRADKGKTFRSYAMDRIRTYMIDYQRDLTGSRRRYHVGAQIPDKVTGKKKYIGKRDHRRQVSLEEFTREDSAEYNLSDPNADHVKQFHGDDLSHYCRGLNEREHKIILMTFRDGLTMKEIGLNMELSESRISQLRGQAFSHIRTRLEEDEARDQGKENE